MKTKKQNFHIVADLSISLWLLELALKSSSRVLFTTVTSGPASTLLSAYCKDGNTEHLDIPLSYTNGGKQNPVWNCHVPHC